MTTPADLIRSYKFQAEFDIKAALTTFMKQTGINVTGVTVESHRPIDDRHQDFISVHIEISC